MQRRRETVITGMGVASPIGIGRDAFAESLRAGRSGVRRLAWHDRPDLPVPFGGEVADFDPKRYVRPRKSFKMMSREIQLAFVAADMAWGESGMTPQAVDPDRLGAVFGADMIPSDLGEMVPAYRACLADGRFDLPRWGTAIAEISPMWMLKYLPNMPACHVAIALDARGPNNSLTLAEASSLAAVAEAARLIERGMADVLVVGGFGSLLNPPAFLRIERFQVSRRGDDPAAACRPFDADRDGLVRGEGAAAFIFEERQRAEARGARPLARVLGFAQGFEPHRRGGPLQGTAIRRAIAGALRSAGLAPADIGHVNAHGQSTTWDDRIEAHAIRDTLGDVPVTAPKSYFGSLGAAGGAVEMAVSLLALETGELPPTLNCDHQDPDCPVRLVRGQPLRLEKPTALLLNHTPFGQAAAVVLGAGD
jgi:3-oxoacyl-[acyl-carrier-protein] synthase II